MKVRFVKKDLELFLRFFLLMSWSG